jgi:type IV secretory pathway TraG/TraD family ATPase VirD4
MRKVFYGLGIFASAVVAVLVILVIGLFFVARSGGALDAESKAYVDDAIVAISARWDKKELAQRASPALKQNLAAGQIDALFDAFTIGLGPLVEYRGATGQSVVTAMIGSGTSRTANYLANARFQKGDAEIRIGLVKIDDRWMIQNFYVNSSALLSNLAGKRT